MAQVCAAAGTHLHLYYCAWTNESRAWREGASALRHGLASQTVYVGHRVAKLQDRQDLGEGQLVFRIGPEPPGNSRWLRAASLPRWWLSCWKEIDLSSVTLIVAHSLAALPVATALKRRSGASLIYDAHELETERAGWSPVVRRIARLFERHLIRRCDHTLVVSDAIRDWYCRTYPGLPVTTIRNIADVKPPSGPSPLRERLGIDAATTTYIYCGAIAQERGLEELVDVFRGLERSHALVLVGDGHSKGQLRIRAEGASNIHFHPAVAVEELVTLISGADVGVFVTPSLSLSYRYCLPNKVFEYAAARLPMMLSDGPELRRFAGEYPAARVVEANRESLREMVVSWTRDDIRSSRQSISHKAPTWRDEEQLLLRVLCEACARCASFTSTSTS